jgi:hypothetical protein
MKAFKTHAIIAIVALLVGRYVLQPKPKEVVKWKEKVVTQTQVKIVTRTVQKPDGTIIIDERIDENSSSKTERSGSKKTGSGITLGLLAIKDLDNFQQTNAEAIVVVPFFGNLKIVGSVDTTKQVGLGLALEF